MIRPIKIEDKKDWEKLYRGYADFYKVEMNDKILATVWKWLFDQNHEVSGLVFEENSKVIALAHYRKMPSPLRGKYIGFLDDLFVDPAERGQRLGEPDQGADRGHAGVQPRPARREHGRHGRAVRRT